MTKKEEENQSLSQEYLQETAQDLPIPFQTKTHYPPKPGHKESFFYPT